MNSHDGTVVLHGSTRLRARRTECIGSRHVEVFSLKSATQAGRFLLRFFRQHRERLFLAEYQTSKLTRFDPSLVADYADRDCLPVLGTPAEAHEAAVVPLPYKLALVNDCTLSHSFSIRSKYSKECEAIVASSVCLATCSNCIHSF